MKKKKSRKVMLSLLPNFVEENRHLIVKILLLDFNLEEPTEFGIKYVWEDGKSGDYCI